MEECFAHCENPALVAKWERLRALEPPVDTIRGRRAVLAVDDLDGAHTTIEDEVKFRG